MNQLPKKLKMGYTNGDLVLVDNNLCKLERGFNELIDYLGDKEYMENLNKYHDIKKVDRLMKQTKDTWEERFIKAFVFETKREIRNKFGGVNVYHGIKPDSIDEIMTFIQSEKDKSYEEGRKVGRAEASLAKDMEGCLWH